MRSVWRTLGITAVAVGAAALVTHLVVRDSISRHRRGLFSHRPLRRLAALGFLAGEPASIDAVLLLRDFIVGEPRKLIRDRARAILARMEIELEGAERLEQGLPHGATG